MTTTEHPDALPLITEVHAVGPVRPVRLLSGDAGHLATRVADAQRVLSDPAFSRAATFRPGTSKTLPRKQVGSNSILFNMDPPEHTRLRGVVARAFNPRRVEAMREGIVEVVDGRLDQMAATGPPADLVEALCAPLPLMVICQLLGVPYEDRASFREWAETFLSLSGHSQEEINRSRAALHRYLAGLVAARRTEPADDLLSELLVARDEEERITEPELVSLGITLLIAGYETTMNQLGRSVYALLTHPGKYAALHRDPGLVPTAVDELLRMVPSVTFTSPRVTLEDVEIDGVPIPAGSMVAVSTIASGRDPEVFTDPEEMNLGRTDNKHLAFGYGPHFCLGARLARTELRIALDALVRSFPGLRLAIPPDSVRWRTNQLIEGPVELPVTW